MEPSSMETELGRLNQELAAQKKINDVLIRRVQRSVDNAGTSFSMFESNILLQNKVEERAMELKRAYEELKTSQEKLVQSEKLASLGQHVAGVGHEINTPIGIGVTTSTHLRKLAEDLRVSFQGGAMTKKAFAEFIETTIESCNLLFTNLERTAQLIRSFKLVYADQANHDKRTFMLGSYIQDILFSLHPVLKKSPHEVVVDCPDDMEMESYPGAISQVLTNFIMNSISHGFENGNAGQLRLAASRDGENIKFVYSDNGSGIPQEHIKKIFDPFFTTKRGRGGTGLGLHIVFNTVTETLKGSIACDSVVGAGTTFTVILPSRV